MISIFFAAAACHNGQCPQAATSVVYVQSAPSYAVPIFVPMPPRPLVPYPRPRPPRPV